MNLLKKLFAAEPAAPEAAEAEQQQPRALTDADIAAVAGGPTVLNDGV